MRARSICETSVATTTHIGAERGKFVVVTRSGDSRSGKLGDHGRPARTTGSMMHT
jgi:hypothetical protein